MFDRVLAVCSTSKRTERLFLFVPGAFVTFHAMKSKERKAIKRIYGKSVKGKYCCGIQGQADPAPTVTPSATSLLSSLVSLRHGDNSKADTLSIPTILAH